jgi:hypothetical protein
MGIVGRNPESGMRLMLERPREGGPPWIYEGAVFTPSSNHPLRVVVSSDGTVEIEVEDVTSRGLIQRAKQMVRAAYKHAADQQQAPPRQIQRWRGSSGTR